MGRVRAKDYSVVVLLAFLAALWIGAKEAQRRGLERGLVYDFVPYALLGGIVGARLYYVIFSNPACAKQSGSQ